MPHLKGTAHKFYLKQDELIKVFPSLALFYEDGRWIQRDNEETATAGTSAPERGSIARVNVDGSSTVTLRDLYAPAGRRWINGQELPEYRPGALDIGPCSPFCKI